MTVSFKLQDQLQTSNPSPTLFNDHQRTPLRIQVRTSIYFNILQYTSIYSSIIYNLLQHKHYIYIYIILCIMYTSMRCFRVMGSVSCVEVHQIRDRKSNREQISAAAQELREKHLIEDTKKQLEPWKQRENRIE